MNITVGEHSGVSPLTGKQSEDKTTTAIKDHMLFCDHAVPLEDFKILASSNSEFHLKGVLSVLRQFLATETFYYDQKCFLFYLQSSFRSQDI